MNCLTINTDASFHPDYKVGGYAFYIVCDLFKVQKAGMFKVEPQNSLEAEMMCIANAIFVASKQKQYPYINLVVINSDALYAFERVGKKKKDPFGRKIANLLRDLRMVTGFQKYEFRHVKAHSGVNDARSKVNEWCDREAKKWMREAVRIKQNENSNITRSS